MNGSAPMMAAEALASMVMAAILPLIFLRSRSTLRQVAERLGEVAAGLLLDGDDDAEEVRLGHRHALVELARTASPIGSAERLALDDGAELGAHRLLRLVGDHAHAVVERQAGA